MDNRKKIPVDPIAYWRFRALVGDIEKATAQSHAAQSLLAQLVELRSDQLKSMMGSESFDVSELSFLEWNDDRHEFVFVMRTGD